MNGASTIAGFVSMVFWGESVIIIGVFENYGWFVSKFTGLGVESGNEAILVGLRLPLIEEGCPAMSCGDIAGWLHPFVATTRAMVGM